MPPYVLMTPSVPFGPVNSEWKAMRKFLFGGNISIGMRKGYTAVLRLKDQG